MYYLCEPSVPKTIGSETTRPHTTRHQDGILWLTTPGWYTLASVISWLVSPVGNSYQVPRASKYSSISRMAMRPLEATLLPPVVSAVRSSDTVAMTIFLMRVLVTLRSRGTYTYTSGEGACTSGHSPGKLRGGRSRRRRKLKTPHYSLEGSPRSRWLWYSSPMDPRIQPAVDLQVEDIFRVV